MGDGEVKTIRMYRKDNGNPMAELQYTRFGDGTIHLDGVTFHDKTSDFPYEAALMQRFIKQARKESARTVEGEIWDTDERTHRQLDILRKAGFDIKRLGNLTGAEQYEVRLKLR